MNISYDKDGFKLSITAGVADEPKGKRRWTQVEAGYMGCPCATLEALASLKAVFDCFRRGQIMRGDPKLCFGSEVEGVLAGSNQKDKVQYLHMQRMAEGQMVAEVYLAHLDVARVEIAIGKALQFLAPTMTWGKEP